jgi:hypothetical protein
MSAYRLKSIELDYAEASKTPRLLTSLSTVVAVGDYLWCAGDEGRTIECLRRDKDHQYRLHDQIRLDDVFPDLPGDNKDEIDIESIDIGYNQLWICGSNCRIRLKSKNKSKGKRNDKAFVCPELRLRPSECLFGAIKLKDDGGALAKMGETLPFVGDGSLRDLLASDEYLAPFLSLPSKENGVDIEGMVVYDGRVLFGLRGPVIGSFAVVVEVLIREGLQIDNRAYRLHFLNLEGLGVRDLAHAGDNLLVLAGPVNGADSPFRIYPWTPHRTDRIQQLGQPILDDWTKDREHPEGICHVKRNGKPGILILYDSPKRKKRIRKSRYRADWFQLPD